MRTVKLVVIGASGVGKTSLRSQYISGRFTTGYRATIGADFITKTLPHHCQDEEFVTLQIWGKNDFQVFHLRSSEARMRFFLMFDVNQLKTMEALTKWWDEFKAKAPVPDEDANKFCCVFVANKIDMTSAANPPESRISEFQAHQFIDELIPPTSPLPSPLSLPTIESPIELPSLQLNGDTSDPPPTDSIEIGIPRRKRGRGSKPSSRSRSRSTAFRGGTIGTMTTTHSIYHTPSSSFFDHFESARASPVPTASYYSYSQSPSPSQSPLQSPRRMSSMSSVSSVPTITPSLFIKGQAEPLTACTTPSPIHPLPEPPESRPKLFFTSAKTGEGVAEVFEYIAKRVVTRWEYEEAVEARTLHMRDASVDDTIRLRSDSASWLSRSSSSCCGS